MESFVKIHEGCEKLWPTFKFLVKVFGRSFDQVTVTLTFDLLTQNCHIPIKDPLGSEYGKFC